MSGLVSSNPDNANPTVHKTAADRGAGKGSSSRLGAFLDEDELELTFSEREGDDNADDESSGTSDDGADPRARRAKRTESPDEPIDAYEIYDLIRSITDPEHPLTLEQLAVVSPEQIKVQHGDRPKVLVEFTPTVPHCSMGTLIGLTIRVRLLRSLPDRFKVDVRVKKGSHESENSLNKQLNDKERVAAALENNHLLEVVQNCLATSGQRGGPIVTGH